MIVYVIEMAGLTKCFCHTPRRREDGGRQRTRVGYDDDRNSEGRLTAELVNPGL